MNLTSLLQAADETIAKTASFGIASIRECTEYAVYESICRERGIRVQMSMLVAILYTIGGTMKVQHIDSLHLNGQLSIGESIWHEHKHAIRA